MEQMKTRLNLQLFAEAGSVVNTTKGTANAHTGAVTPSTAMSPTMKEYYDTELLENARPKQIFTQLGRKQTLPRNHGEDVEWRKVNTFPKALKPLEEGVIPPGQTFGMTSIHARIHQHGDYTSISDRLDLHAVDPIVMAASEEMGAAMGETLDTLTRNELVTGTNVMYADTTNSSGAVTGTPTGRWGMKADNNKLTPNAVHKAVTWLKKLKAPKFDGKNYLGVVHPSTAYDLTEHKDWVEANKYVDNTPILEGEIGKIRGCRFVESTEALVSAGASLFSDAQKYLTVAAYTGSDTTSTATTGVPSAYKVTVAETLTEQMGKDLIGRKVHFWDESKSGGSGLVGTGTIVGCSYASKYIWLAAAPPVTLVGTSDHQDRLYPGEGGDCTSGDCAVYSTLIMGKDAFDVVDVEGGSPRMIIKTPGEIGGPLEQYSTIGYKFETAAKITYQERVVRLESCSEYSPVDEAN